MKISTGIIHNPKGLSQRNYSAAAFYDKSLEVKCQNCNPFNLATLGTLPSPLVRNTLRGQPLILHRQKSITKPIPLQHALIPSGEERRPL